MVREVDSLLEQAGQSEDQGNLIRMFEISMLAGEKAEKYFGRVSVQMANCLSYAGWAKKSMGEYKIAEKLLTEAKYNCEKAVGIGRPDCLVCNNDLSSLYSDICRFKEAEQLLLETKKTAEQFSGKESSAYARSLNNLAVLYTNMGKLEEAESFYLENRKIREKNPGKQSIEYGRSVNNLGNFYHFLCRFRESEHLLIEAKSIWGELLGNENPLYATSLNNLAGVYIDEKKFIEAKNLLIEANNIRLKKLGNEHPDYALSLNNLGNLYHKMGLLDSAEVIYLQVEHVFEKKFGKEHPRYALVMNNLGALYKDLNRYEEAEAAYLVSKNIREKILGREHQDYIQQSLNNLAILYQLEGRYLEAEQLLIETMSLNQIRLIKTAQFFSETELKQFVDYYTNQTAQPLTYTLQRRTSPGKLPQVCFDEALFFKGFLLQTTVEIRSRATRDTSTARRYEQLVSYRQTLNKEYLKPISKRNQQTINDFEKLANALEKELRRALPGFDQALQQVNWQNVRDSLKKNEAAVEFVRFRYYTPEPTDSILYAALVLRPGDESPHFVYLCTEAQLKTVLARWNDKSHEISPAELYYDEEGKTSLYSLLWKPLVALLPQGTAVWYAPAGLLHRLNPDAIYHDTTPLAERYTLRRIGSTRQIALQPSARAYDREALLFGGLRYESDTIALKRALLGQGIATRSARLDERKPASPEDLRDTRSSGLHDLPQSLTEVKNISKTLQTAGFNARMLTGFEGTEEVFLQMGSQTHVTQQNKKGSPRILHLATHGYFFPDPKTDSSARRDLSGMDRHIPYRASDNPFIRSGLLLSGSEQAWRTGNPASSKLADGILTAADIAALDLSGTELTVLSACETGLGDVESNEGVYGLQRAFKIAGSRYLIMSLWKVEDTATMELMTDFYARWLAPDKSVNIPDAFRAAQAKLREKYKDPFYWAGFVLVE